MLRGARGGRRRWGLASVGCVMDNRELCRWTGAPLQLDNPWSGIVNNGLKHIFSDSYTKQCLQCCGSPICVVDNVTQSYLLML